MPLGLPTQSKHVHERFNELGRLRRNQLDKFCEDWIGCVQWDDSRRGGGGLSQHTSLLLKLFQTFQERDYTGIGIRSQVGIPGSVS
jgi:hypothetical protein